jgi:hypothetical protein
MSTALVLLMIPGVGYVQALLQPTIITFNINKQFLLLGSCSKKVGLIATMAFCNGYSRCFLPMVLLGLLLSFLA